MTSKNDPSREIRDKGREIWLAGLGVFSTVEEEGAKLFNKFIEKGKELEKKGENIEKKAREKVGEFEKKAKDTVDSLGTFDDLANFVEEKLSGAFEKIGVSSSAEVKELSEKVDKLSDKVAALMEKLEEEKKAAKTTPKKT
ncbi:MAG: phasin family protein [Calditrichia bacterium]